MAPVTGTISGTVNIERYIPKGYAAHRDLGVCVSGAGTLANTWGQSLNFDSTYTYDANSGWASVGNSTSLQQYKGYRVLVLGYKAPTFPTSTISNMNSAVTLSYSGTLLTGNQNIPLTGGTRATNSGSTASLADTRSHPASKSTIATQYRKFQKSIKLGTRKPC